MAIAFDGRRQTAGLAGPADRMTWTADGAGSGQFVVADSHAMAYVGFGSAPKAGVGLESPFAAVVVVPADPSKSLKDADRLLVTAMARSQNPGMVWNEKRTSVSTKWGKAPPQVEVVKGTLKLDADYVVRALDSGGKVIKEYATEKGTLKLGEAPTVWYELVRK